MITSQLFSIDDFIGFLKLSDTKHSEEDFESIVLKEQDDLLRDLLPADIYLDIISDVNAANPNAGEASKQKFIDLLNGTNYIDDKTRILRGAIEAFIYFTYYTAVQEEHYQNATTGTSVSKNENSEPVSRSQLNVQTNKRRNIGVDYYKELADFVTFFKEIKEEYTTIVEGPPGTYTVTLESTKYLNVTDTIEINGEEFSVLVSIDPDVDIVFTSDAGLTFDDGGSILWKPFKDASPVEKSPMFW